MNVQGSRIQELYEFKLGYNAEATKDILSCEKWSCSWSQYGNQIVEEILLKLQESQLLGKVR